MKKIKAIIIVAIVVCIVFGILYSTAYVLSISTEGHNMYVSLKNKTANINETVIFDDARVVVGMGVMSITNNSTYPHSVFIWDFDSSDGFQVESTAYIANHTYNKSGNYTVTLIVVLGPYSDGGYFYLSETATVIVTE